MKNEETFEASFSSSSIQASYYDNQNNRGRDAKNNFEEMKESIRNDAVVNAMHRNSATVSTGLKCFRMWIQPVRLFTRFSQTFDEVEMPTRSSVQEQH